MTTAAAASDVLRMGNSWDEESNTVQRLGTGERRRSGFLMRWLVRRAGADGAPSACRKAPLTLTVAARSIQPGELVVLTVATATPLDAVRARAFDRDLMPFKIDAQTWRVLVGIDLEAKPGAYPIVVSASAGRATATHVLQVVDKRFPTRTLTVDDAFVNPPASAAARIAAKPKDLARCWANPTRDRLWTGAFVRPGAAGRQQRVRLAQRVQRPGAEPAQRRGLPQPGRHARQRAQRRPRCAGEGSLLFGRHRRDRPRRGAVLALRASVRDRRQGGRRPSRLATSSARSAPPAASRARTCIGPCARQEHGSILLSLLRVNGAMRRADRLQYRRRRRIDVRVGRRPITDRDAHGRHAVPVVPPSQHVPSSCTRAMTSRVSASASRPSAERARAPDSARRR